MGELEKAGEYYRMSIEAREALLQSDPGNPIIRRNLLVAAPGAATDSLATLEEARKLIEPIAGLNTGSAETANQIASITEYEEKPRMSASSAQFTRFRWMPTVSASSA
jgi:hypothetical protein